MNCPSRTEEVSDHPGWNQNPSSLAGDLTTRQDLNGIANLRMQRDHLPPDYGKATEPSDDQIDGERSRPSRDTSTANTNQGSHRIATKDTLSRFSGRIFSQGIHRRNGRLKTWVKHLAKTFQKFTTFIGPGFMIAVAYIDPGNYATDATAGAATRFQLLFVVLMSNVFAVILQSLAIRLGTVTGLNLAEHCRANLPKWMNIGLYILAEAAIIATDIAEVIGSAIALNLLLKIPLVGGCAITLVDVLLILIFYSPNGSVRRLRFFEYFVAALVLAVVICFCIQLSLISETSVGEVFRGYLPSSALVEGQGIYLSCGILGATVMPHSLYLGSGIVQPRLRAYDVANSTGAVPLEATSLQEPGKTEYHPSLDAIQYCLKHSTTELVISLTVFALFVNSAILIVSGASLSTIASATDADLFGIHDLLSSSITPAAGTVFALALLFSGTSAGIVCTIAGQMVSEGQLRWTVAPWLRRLLTRSISITPSIIIAGALGRNGLSAALNATQVTLSIILPFVTAPLIYFTCRNQYMTVSGTYGHSNESGCGGVSQQRGVGMRSHRLVSALAVLVWVVIAIMNVALLVLLGMGKT